MATAAARAASTLARLWARLRGLARRGPVAGPGSRPEGAVAFPLPSGELTSAPEQVQSAGEVLAAVGAACEAQRRLRFEFQARDGGVSMRDIEPYRLVESGAHWYVLAFDVDREAWRTFRLDRMRPLPAVGPPFTPRELPSGADAPFLAEPGVVGAPPAPPSAAAVEAAARWAADMMAAGAAVVVDTETTDLPGAICEIAVVDAATGETLLDTLVDPRVTMSPRAEAVHGIASGDLVGAPTWAEVLPRFLAAVGDRTVLAYNVEFDEAVIRADTARYGLGLGALDAAGRWDCVMRRRAQTLPGGSPLALGAGHRADGDARAALDVVREMASLRSVRC